MPLKEIHEFGKPGDPFQFTVMARPRGIRLEEAWKFSTANKRGNYVHQMVASFS